MDETIFWRQYPDVPQILIAFAVAAEDNVFDDRTIIYGDWFDKSYGSECYGRFRMQIKEILRLPEFPWDPISSIANRYFPDEQSCHEWLVRVFALMEERVRSKKPGDEIR